MKNVPSLLKFGTFQKKKKKTLKGKLSHTIIDQENQYFFFLLSRKYIFKTTRC